MLRQSRLTGQLEVCWFVLFANNYRYFLDIERMSLDTINSLNVTNVSRVDRYKLRLESVLVVICLFSSD